jgi:hypothetical protein
MPTRPAIRKRIIGHTEVRAGDLVPHPLNFRRHPEAQRAALADSLAELGDIRSLLGYRLPDGRIQLIDGHLRRDLDPDRLVTVELVDLTPDEAAKALITLDPLAALAETDTEAVAALAQTLETDSEALRSLWHSLAREEELAKSLPADDPKGDEPAAEKFLVLIECADEAQQVALLERFHGEGLTCKALIS